MTVFEAIEEMRRLSDQNKEFSLSFMSYSLTRDESHGEVTVEHALLRRNAKDSRNSYQDYMETYIDTDTSELHQFWQPLLMRFNHKALTIA